jgi:hypothetical protein
MVRLLILALLALAGTPYAQSTPFSWGFGTGSGGSGGTTSPGGTLTGANQYRSAGGTFAGDDLIIDNGIGTLSLVGVSATSTISASMLTTTGLGSVTNPAISVVGNSGFYRTNGPRLWTTVNGANRQLWSSAGFSNVFGSLGVGGSAEFTPSANLHVSGTIMMTGQGVTCTASTLGSIRYSSTTTSIAACLNPIGTPAWYALASTSIVVSDTLP